MHDLCLLVFGLPLRRCAGSAKLLLIVLQNIVQKITLTVSGKRPTEESQHSLPYQ